MSKVAKISMILIIMVVPSMSISNNANIGTTNFGTNFDHLGLEVFHLTPEEEKLSLLAYEISSKKLNQLGISHVKLNQQGISHGLGEKGEKKILIIIPLFTKSTSR